MNSLKLLAERGWRVTLVELRSHGESDGRRGHVDMWIRYVEDIQALWELLVDQRCCPNGGLATLHTMMHSLTPKVNCVALSNPLLGLFMPPHPIKEQAGRILSKVLGYHFPMKCFERIQSRFGNCKKIYR